MDTNLLYEKQERVAKLTNRQKPLPEKRCQGADENCDHAFTRIYMQY